jgi:molybdopterin converting factor small subunit
MASSSGKEEIDLAVKVKYMVTVREKTGRAEEDVLLERGSTLKDLADRLNTRYGLSLPNPRITAVLNGKGWEQYSEKLATELKDGDKILLFPPLSAG